MHIFYSPNVSGSYHELKGHEARHALRVLRLAVDEKVIVADGKGRHYHARISTVSGKTCGLDILEITQAPAKSFHTEIAVAPPKTAARLEFMLEKLTELGTDKITLFVSDHSERKKVKHERLEKILIAAVKQSKNFYLPQLRSLPVFDDLLNEKFDGQNFIAHCHPGDKPNIKALLQASRNVRIFIGPEGDFSQDEVQAALKYGMQEVNLTDLRLRTETAALYLAQAVDFVNQK